MIPLVYNITAPNSAVYFLKPFSSPVPLSLTASVSVFSFFSPGGLLDVVVCCSVEQQSERG